MKAKQNLKGGKPVVTTKTQKYRDMGERLLANSFHDLETDCWIWLGKKGKGGYGHLTVRVNGAPYPKYAHRVSYEYFNSTKIQEGMELDHLCDTPSCINPGHLREVSKPENLARRRPQRKS